MTGAITRLTAGRDFRFRGLPTIRIEKTLRVAHCRIVSFFGSRHWHVASNK